MKLVTSAQLILKIIETQNVCTQEQGQTHKILIRMKHFLYYFIVK